MITVHVQNRQYLIIKLLGLMLMVAGFLVLNHGVEAAGMVAVGLGLLCLTAGIIGAWFND